MTKTTNILVYTDGACTNGEGGFGAVIMMGDKKKKFFSQKKYIFTTNNRMEARAILSAVKKIKPGYHVNIFTDSQYCQKMFNKCLTHKSVDSLREYANFDIWSEMYQELINHKNLGSVMSISWVRGHDGNSFNEEADRLAEKGFNQPESEPCQNEANYKQKKGSYATTKKKKKFYVSKNRRR